MGALTGVAGGAVPQSGWAISLARINAYSKIEPGRAIVGPGALLRDVQSAAAASGQFYAPDPTENTSSIGGNIAANASGSRSFRYGATREHVLGLRVALIDGQHTRPAPRRTDRFRRSRRFICPRPPSTPPAIAWLLTWISSTCSSAAKGLSAWSPRPNFSLLPAPGELIGGVVFFKSEGDALDAVDRWTNLGPAHA